MSSDLFALCRWSRWARRLHRCSASGTDPAGYLLAVSAVLTEGGFDALLPTHEHAWLFAVGRDRLPSGAPAALAPRKASPGCRARSPLPACSMSSVPHSHAGGRSRTTRCLGRSPARISSNPRSIPPGRASVRYEHPQNTPALTELRASGQELIAQAPAPGQYGQVQALFDDGRLVAAHTSVQAGQGMGGSGAARLSVDHPRARSWAGAVGEKLA